MGIRIPFTADTTGFKKGLANMRASSAALGKQINGSMTGGKLGFLKSAGGAGLLAAGLAILSKEVVDNTRSTEKYKAMLETATGSIDAASEAFDRLTKFAEKTPFSLEQSLKAFITLKNLGLDPSEEAMESYGNTASAMGKDLTQLIEAVADATTGEFERLKEFGIKAKSEGDNVSFTFRGVTKTVGKNSKEIEDFLMNLGETNFAGSMAKQVDTMGGKLSNLGDAWDKLIRRISENGIGTAIKAGISGASNVLEGASLLFGSDKESNIARAQFADDISFGAFNFMGKHEKQFEIDADAKVKKTIEDGKKKPKPDNRPDKIQLKENKAFTEGIFTAAKKIASDMKKEEGKLRGAFSKTRGEAASVPVDSLQAIGGGGNVSSIGASQVQIMRNQENLLRQLVENTQTLKGVAGPIQNKGVTL